MDLSRIFESVYTLLHQERVGKSDEKQAMVY